MRKEPQRAVIAILVVASLGVGYLAGGSGSHTKIATSTTTVVSSATIDSTGTSTLTVGVPIINASDIESGYATIRGQPEYFAVNPNDNAVYVASPFSDNLTAFELLPFWGPYVTALPYYSNGIAIDSSTNIVYVGVANETAAGLAEVNTSVATSGGAGNGGPGKTGNLTSEVVRVLARATLWTAGNGFLHPRNLRHRTRAETRGRQRADRGSRHERLTRIPD